MLIKQISCNRILPWRLKVFVFTRIWVLIEAKGIGRSSIAWVGWLIVLLLTLRYYETSVRKPPFEIGNREIVHRKKRTGKLEWNSEMLTFRWLMKDAYSLAYHVLRKKLLSIMKKYGGNFSGYLFCSKRHVTIYLKWCNYLENKCVFSHEHSYFKRFQPFAS